MKNTSADFHCLVEIAGVFFDFSNKIADMSEKTETKLYDGH